MKRALKRRQTSTNIAPTRLEIPRLRRTVIFHLFEMLPGYLLGGRWRGHVRATFWVRLERTVIFPRTPADAGLNMVGGSMSLLRAKREALDAGLRFKYACSAVPALSLANAPAVEVRP
jgi:hypothetical protein